MAMALLRHLHAWGAAYAPPERAPAVAQPDPASTAQAVLQLLTRLTVRHSIALKVRAGPESPPCLAGLGKRCCTVLQQRWFAQQLLLRKPAVQSASAA